MSFQAADFPSSQVAGNKSHLSAHPIALDTTAPESRLPAFESQSSHNNYEPSSSFSQATSATTNDSDRVFTPSKAGFETSGRNGNSGSGQESSPESMLLQGLSQAAATLEKMPEQSSSKKRTADGMVKHTKHTAGAPPAYLHSRNTSTVSAASTASSRIGDMSTDLKARLAYAMVKVQNGWQSHTIDEVESLASQVNSPTSSTSTLHGRHGSSASPQMRNPSHRPTPLSTNESAFSHTSEGSWRGSPTSPGVITMHAPNNKDAAALAPPVIIQPSRPNTSARRESITKPAHGYLSSNSHHASPHTPLLVSPSNPASHTPLVDPILFSPRVAIRRDDAESLNAAESLLYMSSPGNPAVRNHQFSSSSQPLPTYQNGASTVGPTSQRTALPSQPRKSLPSGRPMPSSLPIPSTQSPRKRVGFQKRSTGDMDVGERFSPGGHGAYPRNGVQRRPPNGSAEADLPRPRLSLSSGLSGPRKPLPQLSSEDINRMIDEAAAACTSDSSDNEIEIPNSTRRRDRG